MEAFNAETLKVVVNEVAVPLPNWARTAVEVGMLARRAAHSNESRLIVCCVVPCRSVFTALVGFGAVLAGGFAFKKGFAWEDFLSVEPGTEIFWKEKDRGSNFVGVVELHEEFSDQILVPVTITKPARKQGRWLFTKEKFYECIFSEDSLPSVKAAEKYARSADFFSRLGIQKASSWLMTSGAEVRLITNRAALERNLEGWGLVAGEGSIGEPLNDLMLLKHEEDSPLAKATIASHLGELVIDCPVTVLDGPLAFQSFQKVDFGSLVFVLERSELDVEHVNFLEEASYQHSPKHAVEIDSMFLADVPESVEITGYCLRTGRVAYEKECL